MVFGFFVHMSYPILVLGELNDCTNDPLDTNIVPIANEELELRPNVHEDREWFLLLWLEALMSWRPPSIMAISTLL